MAPLLVSHRLQEFLVASALVFGGARKGCAGGRGLAEEECQSQEYRGDDLSDEMDDGISLLAHRQRKLRSGPSPSTVSTCVPLANKGSHFTVDIEVGTPPQGNFSVIVDTGSNSLIVQSCVCGKSGHCAVVDGGHCFEGTKKSSTYEMYTVDGWVKPDPEAASFDGMGAKITFGSGSIKGLVVKDVVRIGTMQVDMTDGFLNMYDAALNIAGPTLEGILGLGLPMSGASHNVPDPNNASQTPTKSGLPVPRDMPTVTSFLEQASIQRFSMCFNEGANGVLRLGTPSQANLLGSYGVVHWGLGIEGISVVGASGAIAPMLFELCTPGQMQEGQETPCGAIPDSGTTIITAPKTHLAVIQAAICDAWPRCKDTAGHVQVQGGAPLLDDKEVAMVVKAKLFDALIKDCSSWMNNGTGAAELPTLRFQVTGKNGGAQQIDLPGNSYFFEIEEEEVKVTYEDSPIFGKVPISAEKTGKKVTVCEPAFLASEYNTVKNGPVFILGLPLFYEYQVDYDLGTTPPGIALTQIQDGCGDCEGQPPQLAQMHTGRRQRQLPRRVKGPFREPTIDVNQPL